MKKTKNLQFLLVSACLCSTFVMACACGDNGGGGSQTQDGVTLDLFQKTTLDASSLTGDVTWASSDETVVTVDGGVVTPKKEGSAEITATAGKNTVKYPVTVEDSGARPSISKIDDVTVYETEQYNLYEHLTTTYKSETILEGVEYTYKATADKITVSDAGVITGAKEGIDQVSVSATYMGYTMPKKICNVTVLSANYVKPKQEKVSISTVKGDIDPQFVTLEAEKVVVDAKEIKDATVTATVVTGDKFVTLDGLKVTAKAVGTAKIELSSTVNGKTVKGTVTVTVHDDVVSYNPNFLLKPNPENEASTLELVKEGENKNSYKYTTKKGGSYWDRALMDSNTVTSIPQKGYKVFTYKVKLMTKGTFSVYLPSALASANGTIKYDLLGGRVTEDMPLIVVTDENGNDIRKTGTAMELGKWYTIACDLSTYEDGWAFFGFTYGAADNSEEETEKDDQEAYIKDFSFRTTTDLLPDGSYDSTHAGSFDEEDPTVSAEKDDFINGITIGSAGAKLEKVVSGEFKDTYKWSSKVGGQAGKLTFNDVHDASNQPGKFFKDGNHFISFELFIKNGEGLNACNWPSAADGDESQKVEGMLTDKDTPTSFHVFNKLNRRANLAKGDWYTVVIQVDYDTMPVWTLQYIGLTGSKYSPGVAYIRNFKFSKTMPVEEVIPGESEKLNSAAGTLLEDLKEGDENLVKFTGKQGGNYWENRLGLADVSDQESGQPNATYFNGKNNYVSFKVRAEGKNATMAFVLGNAWMNAEGFPQVAVDLSAKDSKVVMLDSTGTRVRKNIQSAVEGANTLYFATLKVGEWYTVVMNIPQSMNKSPMQCGMRFLSSSNPVVSFKDIAYSAENPLKDVQITEPAASDADKYSVAAGGATLEMGGDTFAGAVKYTNTTSYYQGRMTFAEMGKAETMGNDGKYYTDGNKFVSFKLYCESSATVYALLGSSDKGQTELLAHKAWEVKAYDADMNEVSALETGKWYTVVIRREAADGWFYLSTSGSPENPAVLYFKDLSFAKTWPIDGKDEPKQPTEEATPAPDAETDPEKAEALSKYHVGNKGTIESELGYVKYTSKASAAYEAALGFSYVETPEHAAGEYYTSGKKYISFEVYCMDSTNITAYANISWAGDKDGQTVLNHKLFKVYDAEGKQVTDEMQKGVWYTVVINLDVPNATASYLYVGIAASEAKPAVAYFRGLSFSETDPMATPAE